jgi:hypothetical protein
VQGIEITEDNIKDLAKYIGDIEEDDDGTIYILVDRRKVPNVQRVYVGFYMTRMGKQVRVYSRKLFNEQFILKDETVQPWLDFLDGGK